MSELKSVIQRILASKKVALAAVAAVANFVAQAFGVDVSSGAMAIANVLFAALVGAQTLLDIRWGSNSDGTGQAK